MTLLNHKEQNLKKKNFFFFYIEHLDFFLIKIKSAIKKKCIIVKHFHV